MGLDKQRYVLQLKPSYTARDAYNLTDELIERG